MRRATDCCLPFITRCDDARGGPIGGRVRRRQRGSRRRAREPAWGGAEEGGEEAAWRHAARRHREPRPGTGAARSGRPDAAPPTPAATKPDAQRKKTTHGRAPPGPAGGRRDLQADAADEPWQGARRRRLARARRPLREAAPAPWSRDREAAPRPGSSPSLRSNLESWPPLPFGASAAAAAGKAAPKPT